MSFLFASIAAALTFVCTLFMLTYLLGLAANSSQLLRLLFFVQPFRAITTLVTLGLSAWAAVAAFSAIG